MTMNRGHRNVWHSSPCPYGLGGGVVDPVITYPSPSFVTLQNLVTLYHTMGVPENLGALVLHPLSCSGMFICKKMPLP